MVYSSIQEERRHNNRNLQRVTGPYPSHVELARDILEKPPDESELVMLEALITAAGYTGGGTQVREAGERWSNNRWAVGRVELDSSQHDRTNSQSVWVKPRDSASRGFSGRSPLSTAVTGEKARRRWNGRRPVRTWGGSTRDHHDIWNQLTSYTTIPSA